MRIYHQDASGRWTHQEFGDQNGRGDRNWQGGNSDRGDGRWGNDHRRNDGNRQWNDDGHRWYGGNDAWRNNWQGYRDRNRSRFHLPRYIGPRGYAYRRFYPGFSIAPFFYAQQYWIEDPWSYRLPPVSWPLRWVRYFNDAVLIDVRTGQVQDVVYDFFW
jgi:hypothetical protein